MRVIDTTDKMMSSFEAGRFSEEKWRRYIDDALPGASGLCLDDMRECSDAGYSWEKWFLPVLNDVLLKPEKRIEAINSFHKVADGLDETVKRRFGRTIDADLVLYLGLCSGAGWVTTVNDKKTVLFGIEKIIELDWQGIDAMTGLILHECGHVYHAEYGKVCETPAPLPDQFILQLFSEGVAMVFEQETQGDPEYFHQYGKEWKRWCDCNADRIRRSFANDLKTMTHADQRYFGDWVRFDGYGDTGYYLGSRFVRFLMDGEGFDDVIKYDLDRIKRGFEEFMQIEL